jgi:protein-tyrosine phosphatase
MVDIHSHILWGLDDGADTRETSIAMLQMAAEAGTTDIVATPHANFEYRFDEILIGERIAELSEATAGRPRIHRGCDFHLSFENIEDALQTPARYTINDGPYMLVEFPDFSISHMRQVLQALLDKGLIPILTHPERHMQLREIPPEFLEWVRMGCLVQVTADSLMGRFGKKSEACAWKMVNGGIAHFIASDAHGAKDRTTRLDRAFAAVVETAGAGRAARLFVEHPAAVISGSAIRVEPPPPQSKAWYAFWK